MRPPKRWIALAALTLMAIYAPSAVFAQGSQDTNLLQDDLLKEMDTLDDQKPGKKGREALKAESKPDPLSGKGLLDQLQKNFHGSLRFRGMQYWQNPPEREGADMRNTFGNALAKFTNKIGGSNWDFNIGGWLEYGNEENTYSGTSFNEMMPDRDRRRRILEINELYLNLAASSNFNAVAGKKTLTNGISTLFIPSDRLRPQDLNDPLDPKDLNLWQLRADYFLENTTLTAAFLPVYQEPKLPSEASRWMGQRSATDQADMYDAGNLNMENDRAKLTDTNFGYFARAKTTWQGWDFFASYYHGPNPYYVVREEQRPTSVPGVTEPVKIKEVVKIDTWAAGFSTTKGKWEYHGEAIYNYSYDGKDDNYLSYVGGATYTVDDWAKLVGLEKIDITAEYANEIITNFQNAVGYTSSSKQSRLGRNDIFSRVNLEYSDKLSFQFISNFKVTAGAGDSGRYQRLQGKYKIRDGLAVKLIQEFFGGESGSLYGRWSRNDRLMTELEYSF